MYDSSGMHMTGLVSKKIDRASWALRHHGAGFAYTDAHTS